MSSAVVQSNSSLFDTEITWAQNTFHLDRRLVKAILRIGYLYPTLIQSKCIPIALEGKDILVQARTGSGKTVAYALPLLQKLLQIKENSKITNKEVKAIILAPTKELIKQTEKVIDDLTYYCKDSLSFYAINDDKQDKVNLHLACHPDILIATPAKLAQQLTKIGGLNSVAIVVVDEADIVFSYGYKEDIEKIFTTVPKIFQGFLLSATLPTQLKKFKEMFLHHPAILTLKEPKGKGHILQFFLEATEEDKFLVLYVFLKLGLLQGKGLIFVNDVNKCYRLKLFLQQFFITSAVLNAEIPLNSRHHILEEYNKGMFNYLIASDAVVDLGEEQDDEDEEKEEGEGKEDDNNEAEEEEEDEEMNKGDESDENDDSEEEADDAYDSESNDEEDHDDNDDENDDNDEQGNDESDNPFLKDQKKSTATKDKKKQPKNYGKVKEKDEYGVSRGIDFQGVNFVVNFDFPKTAAAYIHRIGRTARGVKTGTAVSFVTKYQEVKGESFPDNKVALRDYEILQEVRNRQPRLEVLEGDNVFATMGATETDHHSSEEQRMQPAPLVFNTQELEPFRYRVEDVLRNVTTSAVRELRLAEIRREILNSEKLKTYFIENPNDLKVLRHDKAILHPIKTKEHLKYIPEYLIPDSMKAVSNVQMASKHHRKNRKRKFAGGSDDSRRMKSKLNDPLYQSNSTTIAVKTKGREGTGGEQEFLYNTAPSGRTEWKMKHRKGEFNRRNQEKNAYQTKGTFQRAKKKLQKIAQK